MKRLWTRLVVRPWKTHVLGTVAAAEIASARATEGRQGRLDGKTMVVCVVVAVNLTLLHYFGLSNRIAWIPESLRSIGLADWARSFEDAFLNTPNTRLYTLLYWVGACVFLYFVIPVLLIRLVFRQSLADYGLRLRGALRHFKLYVALFLIVLPAVLLASESVAFQRQYPFYKGYDNRVPPGFLAWELAYALQFFALEFFFRGFMVHGLKHRFGAYSVFAMMIPYCMIHFQKPFPETLGAVVAGLVLGFLSLRTGAIWLGFLIHVSVAISMDLAALWQLGHLF